MNRLLKISIYFSIITIVVFIINMLFGIILASVNDYFHPDYLEYTYGDIFYYFRFLNPFYIFIELLFPYYHFSLYIFRDPFIYTVIRFIPFIFGIVVNFLLAFFLVGSSKKSVESDALSVGEILKNGIVIGKENRIKIFLAYFLWSLTHWIPYLNIGTSIGLLGMVVSIAHNKPFASTDIFKAKYRKQISSFILLIALSLLGIITGTLFLVLPGMILSVAWFISGYLIVDKDIDPIAALKKSNDYLYGNRFKIFLTYVIGNLLFFLVYSFICVLIFVPVLVVYGFLNEGPFHVLVVALCSIVTLFLTIYALIFYNSSMVGSIAYIYRKLVKD